MAKPTRASARRKTVSATCPAETRPAETCAAATARRQILHEGVEPAPLKPARAQPTPAKRGPKPGTPSWRKFNFTPELIADCRRRYEETAEFVTSIALDYGVNETTLRRLAKSEGWLRFRPPPRGLPRTALLQARAEALEEAIRRGDPPPAALAPSAPRTAAAAAAGAPPPPGPPFDVAAAIDEMASAVQAELATVKTMRARMKRTPQSPLDGARTARTLSSLTDTLQKLQRMSCLIPQADAYDDIPPDLDAFRDELARRIRVFVASRAGTGDAGRDPGPAAVAAVRP
jgi:hypothetical protein